MLIFISFAPIFAQLTLCIPFAPLQFAPINQKFFLAVYQLVSPIFKNLFTFFNI